MFKLYETKVTRGQRQDTHLHSREKLRDIEVVFKAELAMRAHKAESDNPTSGSALNTILKSQQSAEVTLLLKNSILLLDGKYDENYYFWVWEVKD